MMYTNKLMKIAGLAMLCVALTGCIQESGKEMGQVPSKKTVVGSIEQTPVTRVSIDEETSETGGSIYYWWNPGDEIGIYTDQSNNLHYVNSETEENVKAVTFIAASEDDVIDYEPDEYLTWAYFPYSSDAGDDYRAVKGNVPAEQTINEDLDNIPGMYRWGSFDEFDGEEISFAFRHVLSTIRWNLDVTGTELDGRRLQSVEIRVTRSSRNIPICGDFTFNAETGAYKEGGNTSNKVVINFEGMPTLDKSITFYSSLFPSLKKGDYMYFTVNTVGRTATYMVKSAVAFKRNYAYTFAMPLDGYSTLNIYTNDIPDPDAPAPEPEEPEEPRYVYGTFTCATHNVDGLPNLSINYLIGKYELNPDGPGSDGTKTISSKLAASGWDFVGFSEDFNYHDELTSNATGYTFQEYDNETLPTSVLSGILESHWETDGLSFAAKNSTCTFKQIKKQDFGPDAEAGGLTSGANTCVDKGYRHFEVTYTNGTEIEKDDIKIDVIITHMNTYSDSSNNHINAQHAQLKQIAEYINGITAINKRPVIFMGDTNCRYTRHNFKTYFWEVLDKNLVVSDPWVEYQWAGVYPTYPSSSLMVGDATGTSSSDIICDGYQKGEVVDKIIYINHPESTVRIGALSYFRDYEGYKAQGLGDHCPIVTQFVYEKLVE
ncbi:MAG: fimbrillin family protein [Alistipes sp.]|nr:fimbrillin family protein [Alistipes sp.]